MFSLGYRNRVACDEEKTTSWLALDSRAILVIGNSLIV